MKNDPGLPWRVLAQDLRRSERHESGAVPFDEVVVGEWLHVERIDLDLWWLRIGGVALTVETGEDGRVTVRLTEGELTP